MTTTATPLPRHVPVLIVGAGPVGLTAAALLARYGVESLIVERSEAPFPLPRAIVLDDEGLRALHCFGLDRELLERTVPGNGSRYFSPSGTCFAKTGAGPQTYGYPKRNFLHQPDLEAALMRHVAGQGMVDLRFDHELLGVEQGADGVKASLRLPDGTTTTVSADWLLGCDGGRSTVRSLLGIAMLGDTYGQEWVVIDSLNDPDDSTHSKFFCDPKRPHVSVPAPRGGRRYEFMVMPGEDPQALCSDEVLTALLAPFRKVSEKDILRRAIYTFHARMAERWQEGRIFLMGDAAHLTPPFAGQGMNAGLRDAFNLAWKLAQVVKGVSGPAILDSYEPERRAPAWAMIQLAVAMGQVVMPSTPEEARVLDTLMKALEPFPAARDYLIQMRFKPRPRCEAGLFVDLDAQPYEGSLVGEMIPQPEIAQGGARRMLDDLLGSGWALLAQSPAAGAAMLAHAHPLWDRLEPARVVLDEGAMRGDDARLKPLRTHRDQILILRPDRYVAAACHAAELDATADRLAGLLAVPAPEYARGVS